MKEQQSPSSTDKMQEGVEPLKSMTTEETVLTDGEASGETGNPQNALPEDRPTGRIKEIIIELEKEEQEGISMKHSLEKKQEAKGKSAFGMFGAKKKTREMDGGKKEEDQRDKELYEQYMKSLEEGDKTTAYDPSKVFREATSYEEPDTYYYKDELTDQTTIEEKRKVHPDVRKKRQEDAKETRKKPGRRTKASDTKSVRVKPGLNLFRIIELVVLLVLVVSIGFVGKYIHDYVNTNSLTVKDGKKATEENTAFPRDINPFELFSSRKPDLIATFGDPIKEGEDDLTQERYMYYEYEWFKSPAVAQVFYGKEQRVYQIDIQFKTDSMDEMKEKMQNTLGAPWYSSDPIGSGTASASASAPASASTPSDQPRFIKWIKDSVSYTLTETEDQKAHLKMLLALYPNTNHLDLGVNPTMIERHDGEDYTGDGKPDSIILIGDKNNFTDYYYTNLYILIWDGTQNLIAKFPPNMDGGVMPQMEVIPVQGQGPKLLITSTNNAAKNYNVFQVQGNAFVNLYSSNDAPKDLKK